MTKSVTLKAMNSLKGGVMINSFDLPSNDPAGGIHLTLTTTVKNVSVSLVVFSFLLIPQFSPHKSVWT